MRRLAALLFAGVVLIAACGANDDPPQSDSGSGSDPSTSFNEADVAFAQGMIPHHQQAVEMAALAEDRAESDEVRDLAARIQAAQDPEVQILQGWLEEWGEPTEGEGAMGDMDHGDMDGMMSDEDMVMLGDADGVAFDDQFLEMMAAHHRGAIEMAETELDQGEYPEALTLAEEIIEAQTAEIQEIEVLLAE